MVLAHRGGAALGVRVIIFLGGSAKENDKWKLQLDYFIDYVLFAMFHSNKNWGGLEKKDIF